MNSPSAPSEATDFIGAHVMEEHIAPLPPSGPGRFQECERSHDVGVHELARPKDGPVYVAFCREVDNSIDLVTVEDGADRIGVADIDPLKAVAISLLRRDICKVGRVARVGELIQVDGAPAELRPAEEVADEVCPDKPSPAGDQEVAAGTGGFHFERPSEGLGYSAEMID